MAPNFYFSHPGDELLRGATISSSGTEDDYGPELLSDFSIGKFQKPVRWTGMSASIGATFAGQTPMTGCILWHNALGGETYTVVLGGSLSIAVPMPTVRYNGFTAKVWVDFTAEPSFDPAGYTSWEVDIPSQGRPPGLKAWLFGQYRSTERRVQWKSKRPHVEVAINYGNEYGARWPTATTAWDAIEGSITATDADDQKIRDWFEACRGGVKYFGMVKDVAKPVGMIGYWMDGPSVSTSIPSGLVSAQLAPVEDFINQNPLTFAIGDASAGLPEWD